MEQNDNNDEDDNVSTDDENEKSTNAKQNKARPVGSTNWDENDNLVLLEACKDLGIDGSEGEKSPQWTALNVLIAEKLKEPVKRTASAVRIHVKAMEQCVRSFCTAYSMACTKNVELTKEPKRSDYMDETDFVNEYKDYCKSLFQWATSQSIDVKKDLKFKPAWWNLNVWTNQRIAMYEKAQKVNIIKEKAVAQKNKLESENAEKARQVLERKQMSDKVTTSQLELHEKANGAFDSIKNMSTCITDNLPQLVQFIASPGGSRDNSFTSSTNTGDTNVGNRLVTLENDMAELKHVTSEVKDLLQLLVNNKRSRNE